MKPKYFTIDSEKLSAVTKILKEKYDQSATEHLVESEICADWANANEHQEWINSAPPAEIADWLNSFMAK